MMGRWIKKMLFALFLVITGCTMNSSAEKLSVNLKTEIREVSSFDSIDVRDAYEIYIVCQKEQHISIDAPENILPVVTTEVRGRTLIIKNAKKIQNQKIKIDISVPNLEKISSSGSHQVIISNIDNDRLDIDVNGVGNYQISGKTKAVSIKISGSGYLNAEKLYSEKVKIDLSGSAKVDVYTTNELSANVYGVGTIYYSGNPKIVTRNIYGVGVVQPK